MKFKLKLTIEKPLADVWNIFADAENLKKWQPTLKKIDVISGTPGQTGSVSKLIYEESEREFSLTEKIIHREKPHRLYSSYENEFAHNTDRNTFTELDPDKTLWDLETEYKFKTLIMKITGTLMKRNFVRRAYRDMERFKEFAESIQGDTHDHSQ